MNCKPGDIAITVYPATQTGRIMEVLYAAPYRDHKLPNGTWNDAATGPAWVIKMLDGPARAKLSGAPGYVYEWYGQVKDCLIRPLRPPGEDRELCFENTSCEKP